MKVRSINVKSIIVKSNLPNTDYVVNPYVGCQHGCIYCYAKFMRYFSNINEKWGEFVNIKINALNLLKSCEKYKGKKILFSSVTDPYQPLEAKYKLTRKILKRLIDVQPKIEILTKSRLVTRDIDILKKFDNVTVGISISTINRKYAKILEPVASPPHLRLEALKKCREAGIRTYVFISPILPNITEVEAIIDMSHEYADFFMFENLNIRTTNKTEIYNFIQTYFPHLSNFYRDIYEKKQNTYWYELQNNIVRICKRYGKGAKIYFHL